MSWLKNIGSKVRESGEALKQSQALNSLRETTSTAVASVKRRASTTATSKKSAADLGAELEKGASNVRKAPGLAEMHKAWVQQITVGGTKEAHSYQMEDSERTLGFKEVLLRSRALEVTIETIASDASLRASYSEPPAADDKTSPVACLHVLLAKTLSVPANLWSEVVRLAMCSDGLTSEEHIAWLLSAMSAMKVDWEEEMLTAERKELALRAEYLRQELKQLESTSDDSDATYQRRVAASSELLQTYQAVRSNLEEAQVHRSQTRAAKETGLAHIIEQIQAHMVSLQSSAETSAERQKNMEGELKQSQEGIVLQLDNMTDARNAIDKELEDLEARKRELKMELEEVARKLDETRTRQRKYMEDSDKQRNDLEALKTTVKCNIELEVSIIKEAERERNVIERTQQLLRDTDGVVQRTLGGQLEELRKKQLQFNEHFQQLLKEHISHVEVQLRHLRTRAECSSEEPQQRAEAFDVATAAQQEFEKFSSEYGDCLKGTESEAKVEELTAEHAAIRKLLAPALEEEVLAPTDAAASAEEVLAPTDAAASAEDSTPASAFAPPPRLPAAEPEEVQEEVQVGDRVVLTSDPDEMKRSFEGTSYKWHPSMNSLLGKTLPVLQVDDNGSIIGLEEAEKNSGSPVWFYSRKVATRVLKGASPSSSAASPAAATVASSETTPTESSPSKSPTAASAATQSSFERQGTSGEGVINDIKPDETLIRRGSRDPALPVTMEETEDENDPLPVQEGSPKSEAEEVMRALV